MKITYFNYMADLYGYSIGSTIKALKLFQKLESIGHTIFFHWLGEFYGTREAPQAEQRSPSLLRAFFFTPRQILGNISQFFLERKIIKKENPEMLVARLDAFRFSALLVARLYHLPLVIEADGACSYEWLTFNNGPHIWDRLLLWCEKIVLRHADGIFTQSCVAKEYYIKTHKLDKDALTVITNGADPVEKASDERLAELRQELGIYKASRVVGFVGSMQQWHGVQEVQNLVRDVLQAFDDVVFLFIGGGGTLEQELVNNLNASNGRVIFTGTLPNNVVSDYIQLFTIAIAPYPPIDLFYFSPMKVFEYMAAQVPIIASRSGQIAQILQDRESALLYEPGDIGQLREKIVFLLNNLPLQKKIARNAHDSFVEWHTWSNKANELDEYLNRCRT
ncbi:glycosyltransferase family 1 protein [candidate division KSB1 bacterium]|nr:glycosyltransferase family 4 protein [candidate division KSB1 bacterium]RQW06284.1 MAG: glycosyltransferase family 1 protein [candidate division KSB1 bacterium]